MATNLPASERALLTGEWDASIVDGPAATLAKAVVDGDLHTALTTPIACSLLKIASSDASQPLNAWLSFVDDADADEELARLALAVACLHAFLQINWTGPTLDVHPLDVLDLPPDSWTEAALNDKAVAELAHGGEPAYHLAKDAVFLRLAQILLALPYKHCTSVAWWRLRCVIVHEQVLDEAVPIPEDVLSGAEAFSARLAPYPDLAGSLLLEQGLLHHHLGDDRAAATYYVQAGKATGLEYVLTGALGKRTKFQQNDITQLVLLAESRKRDDGKEESAEKTDAASSIPETLALNDDTLLEHTAFTSSAPTDPSAPAVSPLAHIDPSAQPPLHPLDQCILLALCLNVRNTSPAHGLTHSQMAPYVARVLSHPRAWSVHTTALLLRARLEAGRTRTVERAALQLQALVDQIPADDASPRERLRYVHALPLPSRWEMERELAQRLFGLGVVRSALDIFERLEMWEEVVKCWQAMERRDKGVSIVRDLLEGRKEEADVVLARGKESAERRKRVFDVAREAKLWCLLGELEPEHAEEHFQKAWQVSKETSGRAMRSLGGLYFAKEDFANAILCLRKAVLINPLSSRSWFILGCACTREEDWEGAREAFTRCVSIDDQDAESWNNLASAYLRMAVAAEKSAAAEGVVGEDPSIHADTASRNSVPFHNKMLAFRALKQGLKYSYENWRMWSNYMIVSVDVGELSEACRAQGRIVEERSAKDGADCVDEDVLERLVDAVTRAPSNADDAVAGTGTAQDAVLNPNEGHGLHRRVQELFERTILPRVSSPRIFRAYARLLTWQARWADALQAHLDAYRAGPAGGMEKGETDAGRWRKALSEVEEIVDVLRNFGPRAEDSKWLAQARSIVRTFMGRTKDFDEEPEWTRLESLLEELRNED